MKQIFFLSLFFMYILAGCDDKDDPPINTSNQGNNNSSSPGSSNKGGVLFWTGNAGYISTCGGLTIKLNTGQQTNIYNFYAIVPGNCVNLAGGYFYLDAGNYTYTISTPRGCNVASGSITVKGNQCNLFSIQ